MKTQDGYKKSIEHFLKTEKFISPTRNPKGRALAKVKMAKSMSKGC